jgi:outer membrane protein
MMPYKMDSVHLFSRLLSGFCLMKKLFLVKVLFVLSLPANAQVLVNILEQAKENYPLIKAHRYEVEENRNQVAYARSAAIPELDAGFQMNYATYNNITGMAATGYFVPISGPPSASNSDQMVFGTVGGVVLNWDVLTFGQRRSAIESARSSLALEESELENEIFQHRIKTARAYLDLVMTYELVNVYTKNLERAEDNVRIVRSLAASGLRPGVDTALFVSELSRARIELVNYEQLRETHAVQLSELLGSVDMGPIAIDSSFFKVLPQFTGSSAHSSHPLLELSSNRLDLVRSERQSIRRSLNPKLSLWGTAYGRGSGVRHDGYTDSDDGLSFSRYNYGAGLEISVPLLNFARVNHLVRATDSRIQVEQENLNLVELQLAKQEQLATVTLQNALEIARESPYSFAAADYAYRALMSRYNAGLVSYGDLIQAQYALVKAESDLKKTYIDAWKALLFRSAVSGDLDFFINQLPK